MDTDYSTLHAYYQKGYADGYKRYKNHIKNKQYDENQQYVYNVIIVVIIFSILLGIVVYSYGKDAGLHSQYEGDCLIDLATSYQAGNCLNN